MMFELTGKTAWVTGSSRNLGRAMAEDMARQGADVVISSRSSNEERERTVSELREEYDTNVYDVQVDISDLDSVEGAVDEIRDRAGSVDILVNNAATRPHQAFEDISPEDWDEVLQTNLKGVFHCVRTVLPDMREQGWGRIVNISGVDAVLGKPQRAHVVSTKMGIIGLTRAMAQEFAADDITVNCVVPGVFRTERDPDWHPNPEVRYEGLSRRVPLERLGQPNELSPAIVFLVSEEACYITGQTIHVNGGLFPTMRDPTELDLDDLLDE